MTWIKDPIWIFLLIGAAIFVFANEYADDEIAYDVVVGQADITRLSDQWSMQMRRPPTQQELDGLVEQFIKEEIYYREARRLSLDTNDTIVRRRMVQKLTFLTEDIATAVPQDEGGLLAYYNDNQDSYELPERFSFHHRYFSTDRRDNALNDATQALDDNNTKGDAFMLQKSYALRSKREIGDLFGRDFAAALAKLEPGEQWQGPIKSAYGWHPLVLTTREPATLQTFNAVKDRVLIDAQQAARKEANATYYADLKSKYNVEFPVDTGE